MDEENIRNTQDHRTQLCKNLQTIKECSDLHDVVLVTQHGKHKQSLKCHKLILMAASEYLRKVIVQQGKTSTGVMQIDVSPVRFPLLVQILAYIYTGECEIDDSNVTSLLGLSVEWKLIQLSLRCLNHIKYVLTVDNVSDYYESLTIKQCNDLAKYTTLYIRGHFTELCKANQLNIMSFENFCNILKSDEINVDTEDVIFDSVIRWTESNPDVKDLSRLFGLIRYQGLSKDYLCDVVVSHKLMQDVPQIHYVREAMKAHVKQGKSFRPPNPRIWTGFDSGDHSGTHGAQGQRTRLVSILGEHICFLDSKRWTNVMKTPNWLDSFGSMVTTYYGGLVIPRCPDTFTGWQIYLLNITTQWHTRLPDLPRPTNSAGILYFDHHVYVAGGANPDGFGFVKTNNVYRILVDGNSMSEWEELEPMGQELTHPIMIADDDDIYVIGGYDQHKKPVKNTHVYNKQKKEWRVLQGAPEECDSVKCGGILYRNEITIFTSSCCMVYQSTSDTWRIKEYELDSDDIKPVLYNGRIMACVRVDDKYSLCSFNMTTSTWKKEGVDMNGCCAARYLHTL